MNHRASTAASSSRLVAASVLRAVFEEDAYAAPALSAALDRSQLSERDKRLSTELVYGVLRTMPYLMRRIESLGKVKRSDHLLVSHLLIAAYQLAFLDRVPPHAAVDEAVRAIRSERGRQVGGFANAVLRNLSHQLAAQPARFAQAVLESCPSWLRKRLERAVGVEEAHELLIPERTPRLYLRFRQSRELPVWVEHQAERVAPDLPVFRFQSGGDPRKHAEFAGGAFVVQELGSILVGYLVGAERGDRILDVCAGRGQKSLLLAEAVGNEGQVWATDLHEHKLRALGAEAERLRLAITTQPWDWTEPPPEPWRGHFDKVLVDAPCTGVGTLRRRPEILRRLGPADPQRMSQLQWTILQHAAVAVRPGGILILSSCSVFAEEGEQLAERLSLSGAFAPWSGPTMADTLLGARDRGVPASLRLSPLHHDSDGYFVARLQKL